VIEVNALPGLDPHLLVGAFDEPTLGRLVLGPEPGRIPVAVVLAEPSVQQALLAGLDASGWACDNHFGVVGAGRMRLGVLDLVPVGPSVLQRTRQLLAHRRCHVAVLMVDPDEVATLGLPVDRCALAIGCAPGRRARRQLHAGAGPAPCRPVAAGGPAGRGLAGGPAGPAVDLGRRGRHAGRPGAGLTPDRVARGQAPGPAETRQVVALRGWRVQTAPSCRDLRRRQDSSPRAA
jgi:hypothetical protein